MTQQELDKLSAREIQLYDAVCNIDGLLQDQPEKIDSLNIFDEYIDIHKTYAASAETNPEALKRAIFIQWYSYSEPSALTGIPGGGGPFDGDKQLDRKTEIYILHLLNNLIPNNQLDTELMWMLCYYGIWEEYFTFFPEFETMTHLQWFISNTERYPYPKKASTENFKSRGQMGLYWISICCR
jgi:hypothetical protein